MEGLTRHGLAGLTVLGAAAAGSAAANAPAGPDPLDGLAKAKGFVGFGSAMGGGAEEFASSFNDAGVRTIQQRECAILISENQTKWVAQRPDPKESTFYLADRMVDWARDNNMLMRGCALLWQKTYRFLKWLVSYDVGSRSASEANPLLLKRPSPFDGNDQPKPLRQPIATAFRNVAARM